jgi:hypothetical protein
MRSLSFLFYSLFLFFLALSACESAEQEAKRLNDEAIRIRITSYMKDPDNMLDVSDYTPLYYSELDTLTDYWLDSVTNARFHLIHKYKGRNVASRWVKRSASVFFNEGLEVVDVKTILYHNPMNKDTLKARYQRKN